MGREGGSGRVSGEGGREREGKEGGSGRVSGEGGREREGKWGGREGAGG